MAQPRIEDPLGFFEKIGNGWDDTQPGNAPEAQAELERREQDDHDLNVAILKTFSSTTGKKVWAWLEEAIMKQPTWCASLGMERGTAHGFAREGQMSVYRTLEDKMKAAVERKKDVNQKGKANG